MARHLCKADGLDPDMLVSTHEPERVAIPSRGGYAYVAQRPDWQCAPAWTFYRGQAEAAIAYFVGGALGESA